MHKLPHSAGGRFTMLSITVLYCYLANPISTKYGHSSKPPSIWNNFLKSCAFQSKNISEMVTQEDFCSLSELAWMTHVYVMCFIIVTDNFIRNQWLSSLWSIAQRLIGTHGNTFENQITINPSLNSGTLSYLTFSCHWIYILWNWHSSGLPLSISAFISMATYLGRTDNKSLSWFSFSFWIVSRDSMYLLVFKKVCRCEISVG